MSTFAIDALRSYRRERLPVLLFLPASVFLGLTAAWAAPITDAWRVAGAISIAYLCVAQFRLLDDLADRNVDRLLHPARVTTDPAAATPLAVALVVMSVFNGFAVAAYDPTLRSLWGLLLLNACALAWYSGLRGMSGQLLAAHVSLVKYPAIVWVAMGSDPADLTVASLWLSLVYLSFTTFELGHDGRLRSGTGGLFLLLVELGLLAFASLLVAGQGTPDGATLRYALWPLVVLLLSVVGIQSLRGRVRGWYYAVFVAGFLNLIVSRI